MPRSIRIQQAGYHHVYNRAIEKKRIFNNSDDKDMFIEILNDVSNRYRLTIHCYCIMSNHYHLLVENQLENLSLAMRQLNSKYASYYNKKHKRVGHLWQDRFKSKYILDEKYLYTLYKYIEQNPVKAKICKKIGEYKYSSSYAILNNDVPLCAKNSFAIRDFTLEDFISYLSEPLSKKELENLKSSYKEKLTIKDEEIVKIKQKSLKEIFADLNSKQTRNRQILEAFSEGYKQSEISTFLSLSTSSISKIIRKQL